jgi:regulator of RNase E activity RraA
MSAPDPVIEQLRAVGTATLTTVLLERGLRAVSMRGPQPLAAPTNRIAGRAFTLSFVPAREDLASPASWASPKSTRAAIEAMPEGAVVVVDARGIATAGIFGDILCSRMVQRRAAGLVTDGVVRDRVGVEATGLPVWCAGVAAPPSVAGLAFIGWQQPIGCGGVAVMTDDYVVADADGAVVVPAAVAAEVASAAREQEAFEEWALAEVQRGVALPGLYPPNEATLARYRAHRDADSRKP